MELSTIKSLSNVESIVNGTSLITLYIPANNNLWLAVDHIDHETKTASNIKNKNVGKAVTIALKSVSYHLKNLQKIPTNGIVVCAGTFMQNIPITELSQCCF